MRLKTTLFLLVCLFYGLVVRAQSPVLSPGNIETVSITDQSVSFKTANAYGAIAVYSPSVIRIRLDKKPLGKDFSYAVVASPQKTKTTIKQSADSITLITDSLKAIVYKKPFRVAFYTLDGQLINQDESGLSTSWVESNVTCYKTMMPDERFIGLGEKTGPLDRKGNGYTNWNSDTYGYLPDQDPIYSTIPFYIGLHHQLSYGIFLDNSYQSDFNFGASNNRFSSFGARGGEMNYYFIYHRSVANIISSYTWLTGRMKMPPLWSLGYQQNRYSYYPESTVMRIAQTLREDKIPSDGITLDIHYMDRYQLFTWNKQRFPDPAGMASKLNAMGFKLTVIVDPGIKVEKGAVAYESGLKQDVYVKYTDGQLYTAQVWPGWCNFTDFTNAKGREWWRNQVNFFAQSGVSGIWNDMNEFSTWGQKIPDNILFDFDGHPTTNLQAHNVYGLEMARSSYEGAREHMAERPFILSRSGYAGLQRYAAIWTGDNRAEDSHMLLGVRLLNSLGLSGVPFTGMDIGGFTGNPTTPLYIRWMELGAFIPYYRNHTALNTKASEPWNYGEDALDICRNYVSFRYKLLPYIYSTFYESTQDGLPVVRSLAINYSFDPKVYASEFENQYLFGKSFMITPFESTKDYGKVYFPAGNWYDLYTDEKHGGNREEVLPLTISKLPVFVKESSIIPMQNLIQSTAETPADTLTLHVYNGTVRNEFTYYEDDGKSYKYEQNDFNKRTIVFDPASRQIIIGDAQGNYKSNFHHAHLVLHGFDNISQLSVNGQVLKGSLAPYSLNMAPGNIDPQGTSASNNGGAKVYQVLIGLSNQKQTIIIE